MSATCPAGHTSTAEDYCDVCGMPIEATAAIPPVGTPPPPPDAPTQKPTGQPCPNCQTENAVDALFCENCGFDFTTGTPPRPLTPPEGAAPPTPLTAPEGLAPAAPPAAPQSSETPQQSSTAATQSAAAPSLEWVAEIWIDPAWYEAQESPDPLPSPGLPAVVPLRPTSVLIGRASTSRNIHPEVDCDTDSGVSRRQAQLTTDGTRWWVEDLDSANGTFVAAASAALPLDPIAVGVKRELAADDRVYVGAWTRIVIRRATEDEQRTL
jgi:hypothetical protein